MGGHHCWVLGRYPREVPDLPWYRSALPQMLVAGMWHLRAFRLLVHCVQQVSSHAAWQPSLTGAAARRLPAL